MTTRSISSLLFARRCAVIHARTETLGYMLQDDEEDEDEDDDVDSDDGDDEDDDDDEDDEDEEEEETWQVTAAGDFR